MRRLGLTRVVLPLAESLGVWADPSAPVGAQAFVSAAHIHEMLGGLDANGSNGINGSNVSNGSNGLPFSRPGHAREVTLNPEP